jgi:hypothetical protein
MYLVEMGVEAAMRQQFFVCARFHNDAVLQNEDGVRLSDRRQPVRDHDGGFVVRLRQAGLPKPHDQPPSGRCQRSPLVAEFQDTRSNGRFLFMVNHLARGDNILRRDQGQRLNDWVRTQTLPVIATGDYNFDWSVTNGDQNHDVGFDRMTAGEAWTWVRPATLVRSQCNPNFDSVLDFVFVNTAALPHALASLILQEANDCGNAAANPDHRPLRAEFELGAVAPAPTRAELLQRIEAIERQIVELKALMERLP